jgi:hypothetical protein
LYLDKKYQTKPAVSTQDVHPIFILKIAAEEREKKNLAKIEKCEKKKEMK